MIVFLVLSGLGIGFYAVLLVALYRDSRRRRRTRVELYQELDFDRASVLVASRHGTEAFAGSAPKLADEVLWLPVTKVQWKPVASGRQRTQSQPATLAAQHNNNRLKYS